jgi:hypothetical protein
LRTGVTPACRSCGLKQSRTGHGPGLPHPAGSQRRKRQRP